MNMLPFTIKMTDQLTVRLCRVVPSAQHQEFDVDVQSLIRLWEIDRLYSLRDSTRRNLTRQILNEAQEYAYKVFTGFLRGVAEPESFLPTDLLAPYPHRQYCLLLSPSRARELFEVYNTNGRHSQHLVNYRGYDLIVNPDFQLSDREAYLIALNKYVLFLRQANETDGIKMYRSDFIDLTGNTPPPLDLRAQDVIDTVQNDIPAETEREPRYQQLLMFPPSQREEASATVKACPKCGGNVQKIGGDSFFCLECDWDNLPTLI